MSNENLLSRVSVIESEVTNVKNKIIEIDREFVSLKDKLLEEIKQTRHLLRGEIHKAYSTLSDEFHKMKEDVSSCTHNIDNLYSIDKKRDKMITSLEEVVKSNTKAIHEFTLELKEFNIKSQTKKEIINFIFKLVAFFSTVLAIIIGMGKLI